MRRLAVMTTSVVVCDCERGTEAKISLWCLPLLFFVSVGVALNCVSLASPLSWQGEGEGGGDVNYQRSPHTHSRCLLPPQTHTHERPWGKGKSWGERTEELSSGKVRIHNGECNFLPEV